MQLAASIDDRIEPKPFKKELFNRNDPLVDEIQKNGIQFIWNKAEDAIHNSRFDTICL